MASNLEKQRCAERELRYRMRVYPGRVAAGKMTEHEAQRQIALMEDIVADYRRAVEREPLPLFNKDR